MYTVGSTFRPTARVTRSSAPKRPPYVSLSLTSPSPLERLADPGNGLAKEAPDTKECAGLIRSGLARLKDAENEV